MTAGLSQRRRTPEWMDSPQLPAHLHRQALRGLERINRWSRTTPLFWHQLVPLLDGHSLDRPLRVLDVATGAGDLPRTLNDWATKLRIPVQVDGCDLSPFAIEHARRHAARAHSPDSYFVHDVIRDGIPEGYDVILSALFLHHLSRDQALNLLHDAARRARLVLISDLERSWPGLSMAWLGTRLLTRSPVVRVDGPLSVRAAFTLDEVSALADKAGWRQIEIQRHWPCRYLLKGTR